VVEIRLPRFDVNDEEAEVKKIYVNTGDHVEEGDPLFDLETTKTVETIFSPSNGYVKVFVEEDKKYRYGELLAIIFDTMEELEAYGNGEKGEVVEVASLPEIHGETKATKKALLKARELGIDISEIRKDGIIREKDVISYYVEKFGCEPGGRKITFKYDFERVVIIGAGRGAEVVTDIILEDKDKIIVGLVDDHVKEFKYFKFNVIFNDIFEFPQSFDRNFYDTVIISIGANLKTMQLRDRIYKHYKQFDIKFTNAISKTTEIRRGVEIGEGNIIGSRAYVGTMTIIGNNNSISYGALIGHHNVIGDSNLIAPGVVTSGSVTIGSNCIISAGVSVINRVKIGDNVILPVGYAVTKDLSSGTIIKYSG